MKNIIIILLFLLTKNTLAAITTTGSSSNFDNSSAWSCSCVPDFTFWDGSKDSDVSHNLTKTGSLTLTNFNMLTVKSGATLTITGDLNLGYRGQLTVESGGKVIIQGKLNSDGSEANITNSGTINITGDFKLATSSIQHNLGGVITVGGNFYGTGNTNINLSGSFKVTGQFKLDGNSFVVGNGSITWGSYYILNCGASYVQCAGTQRRVTPDGCGGTAPPATGLNLVDCSEPSTMPIELYYFKVSCINEFNQVTFNWATLTETNNEFFTIEKLIESQFKPIVIVPGNGNSNKILNYYESITEYDNIAYYRLKQTDFDGKSETFNIITSEKCDKNIKYIFNFFNNKTLFINEIDNIQIYNDLGQIIFEYDNLNNYLLTLKPGLYIMVLNNMHSEKLLITK